VLPGALQLLSPTLYVLMLRMNRALGLQKSNRVTIGSILILSALTRLLWHVGSQRLGNAGKVGEHGNYASHLQHQHAVAAGSSKNVDLTHVEAKAISDLRALVSKSKFRNAPETLLQHCCIASNNDVEHAFAKLQDILRWREDEGVDKILEDPIALTQERWYRKLLHYDLTGPDRKGRAVLIEAFGRWDMDALDKAARERREAMIRSHVVVSEKLLKYTQAANSARATLFGGVRSESHVDVHAQTHLHQNVRRSAGNVAILDLGGMSLKQGSLPSTALLQTLREISQVNANYYPGTIEQIFVVNTPAVFKSFWRLLAPFIALSSGVRVDFLSAGDTRPLVQECGKEVLPVQLGGVLPANSPPYAE